MSNDSLDVLLRIHDGDDRCGCLRLAILLIDSNQREEAIETIRECLEMHPSGSIYRRNQ